MLIPSAYHKLFFILLSLALLGSLFFALSLGSISLPLSAFSEAFFNFQTLEAPTHSRLIIWELRLPRALLAMCVGALLACSGAAMQGLFRNPLADPSLIGVTAGASLGASLAIFFASMLNAFTSEYSFFTLSTISVGACLGAAMTVFIVYRIATTINGTSVTSMLLTGIAVTALVGSTNSLLEFFSDNSTLRRLSVWRMGSFEGANYSQVALAASLVALCIAALCSRARTLNAFLLGESEARHLGIPIEFTKRLFIIIVALGTGVSVALAGTIAFVGLVVPHLMRLCIGPDHVRLLPASALCGALLVSAADTLARTLIAPTELPVGLVTALLGAPFFILILRRVNDARR